MRSSSARSGKVIRHKGMLLALAWYLLVPPFSTLADHPATVHSELPISEWNVRGRFRSEQRCRIAMAHLPEKLTQQFTPSKTSTHQSPLLTYSYGAVSPEFVKDTVDELARNALCVHSTDPRLGKLPDDE